MERKVKFRLEREINEKLNVWECVIHREGMEPIRTGMAKKEIVLVAAVANTMSCIFDSLVLLECDNIEFELTVKTK